MGQRTTIRDIAREAGVSSVTISRVVNAPELVRPETRARVQEAMRRLGYVPNLAARAMRTRFTRTIGFLVPDILSYSNAAVAQAAERALAAEGYGMMLVSSGRDGEDEIRALEMLRLHRMDGTLIYVGAAGGERLVETMQALDGPSVVLDRTLPLPTDTVLTDHVSAMGTAVQYLASLGHRRLTLLQGASPIRPLLERRKAFLAAVSANGLAPELQRVVGVLPEQVTHFRAASLLAEEPRPTALLVDGGRLLRSLVEALRERGMTVPRDLSIIGIDVEDVAPTMTPELTRIGRNYGDIGRIAAQLLLERIKSAGGPPRSVMLDSYVLLKGSCGPAPAG